MPLMRQTFPACAVTIPAPVPCPNPPHPSISPATNPAHPSATPSRQRLHNRNRLLNWAAEGCKVKMILGVGRAGGRAVMFGTRRPSAAAHPAPVLTLGALPCWPQDVSSGEPLGYQPGLQPVPDGGHYIGLMLHEKRESAAFNKDMQMRSLPNTMLYQWSQGVFLSAPDFCGGVSQHPLVGVVASLRSLFVPKYGAGCRTVPFLPPLTSTLREMKWQASQKSNLEVLRWAISRILVRKARAWEIGMRIGKGLTPSPRAQGQCAAGLLRWTWACVDPFPHRFQKSFS